jgi:hypothetical protein
VATSQNGYEAGVQSAIHTVTVPGTAQQIPVRIGPAGDLLIWAAARFHREVEPLHVGWCWGYAYRNIRGSSGLSNHASGTAIDLNAPAHPLGTNPSSNYTPAKIAAIHRIIADAQGALRWGGDYGDPAHGGVKNSRPDGMHVEVIKNEAECARVLAIVTKPAPAPAPSGGPVSPDIDTVVRNLDRDLRADLHVKQLELDGIRDAVAALTAKVDALASKLEVKP